MYEVELDPVAEQQRDALPTEAGVAFMELRAMLEVSPWSGDRSSTNPAGNMLTHAFGGDGLAWYVVMEERRFVYVTRIIWFG